jgi:hypothetical protein
MHLKFDLNVDSPKGLRRTSMLDATSSLREATCMKSRPLGHKALP